MVARGSPAKALLLLLDNSPLSRQACSIYSELLAQRICSDTLRFVLEYVLFSSSFGIIPFSNPLTVFSTRRLLLRHDDLLLEASDREAIVTAVEDLESYVLVSGRRLICISRSL